MNMILVAAWCLIYPSALFSIECILEQSFCCPGWKNFEIQTICQNEFEHQFGKKV